MKTKNIRIAVWDGGIVCVMSKDDEGPNHICINTFEFYWGPEESNEETTILDMWFDPY